MGDWIVKIIESVYNFLWGDTDRTAPARRRNASAFSSCDHSDTSRALFYGTHKVSSCSSVSGYGKSGYRQKNKRKGFSVSHAVPDRFYCHTSGNGKPGGRGGDHFLQAEPELCSGCG